MTFQLIVQNRYHISSYSFRGNYSFFNLKIVANSYSCRNISIFYLINWIFTAKTIQGRKSLRSETIWGNTVSQKNSHSSSELFSKQNLLIIIRWLSSAFLQRDMFKFVTNVFLCQGQFLSIYVKVQKIKVLACKVEKI